MRVLHVPYTFFPDPVGGTEIYVEELANSLTSHGISSAIAAPGSKNETYERRGLRVYRFAVSETLSDLSEMYGEGDSYAAGNMARILEEELPDVLHLHSYTRATSLRLGRLAHARGIPVVFTYHTPTVSCARGTLLHWGEVPCDGFVQAERCAACVLQSYRLPKPLAIALSKTTPRKLRWTTHTGHFWTVLRTRELLSLRERTIHSFLNETDHLVALSNWTVDLLHRNGIAEEKISLVPHGMTRTVNEIPTTTPRSPGVLKIIALGRLDTTKGFDVLIRAIRQIPEAPLRLDIYGVAQSESGERYAAELDRLRGTDPRIRIQSPVPHYEVVPLFQQYDLAAVPSHWIETGPLVILEAFAAGIPVIGSNLGGIADKIQDGVNGVLVKHSSVRAWRNELQALINEPTQVTRLKEGAQRTRIPDPPAEKLLNIYTQVLQKQQQTQVQR